MKWINFDMAKGGRNRQKLPLDRQYVLVQIAAKPEKGLPPAVAVGYVKFFAGVRSEPHFVTPGVGGTVTAWCDCLPADFIAPLWPGTHRLASPVTTHAISDLP